MIRTMRPRNHFHDLAIRTRIVVIADPASYSRFVVGDEAVAAVAEEEIGGHVFFLISHDVWFGVVL